VSYQSTVPAGRDGFAQILRAEWTKFRSLRSTAICVVLMIGLTILLTLLTASGSGTDANDGPHYTDHFEFVHQPMAGDGVLVARVSAQANSQGWAKAGIIIKDGTTAGSPYAAALVTPAHGVRMEGNFSTGIPGGDGGAPRWLKLTRTGQTVTAAQSADGTNWTPIGTMTVRLGNVAQVGLFVASPANTVVTKVAGGSQSEDVPTNGSATFDNVSVQPAGPAEWRQDLVDRDATAGTTVQLRDGITVQGSGDMSGYGLPSFHGGGNDDIVINSLAGVQIGLLAVIALGVLFASSEFKTGLVRTTFAASPRRGRVFVAKAIVLAGTVFVAGLVASVASFLLAQPRLHDNGYVPPAYPYLSLTDAPVARAVIGTALFLAVLAVLSLGVGTILRRSARSIMLMVGIVLAPQLIGEAIPNIDVGKWIARLTPVAGLAIQQTRARFDTAIAPWPGFVVVCAYAVLAMVAAVWLVRKRDA